MKPHSPLYIVMLLITTGCNLVRSTAPVAQAMRSNANQDNRAFFQRPENIPYPQANPFSEEKFQLGKKLFFDPRLSKSNMISCASCHNPGLSWTDGLAKGVGHNHQTLPRRVPTILNAAWGKQFFWDGRAASLEEQALGPIQAEGEMNTKLPELMQKLGGIAEYKPLFQKAFPNEALSPYLVAKAIATFEREIVSDLAPFDYWVAGEEKAISENAKRGFGTFHEVGCVRCHTGWNFTNGQFADIGLPSDDMGKGKLENNPAVAHAFKTPTLRNIARRGPYMHDGSLKTLKDVIENYNRGGTIPRVTTKYFLKPLRLSEQQKLDLIAFLETLTSEDEPVTMPSLPRGEWKGESWVKFLSAP